MRLCVRMRMCWRWKVMTLWDRIKDIFRSQPDFGPKEGTYKFDGKGALAHHRFHLRVDGEGKGVLIIDASKLVFLNGTALDYAKSILEGLSDKHAVRHMMRRYRGLDKTTALRHLDSVRAQISEYLKGNVGTIQTIGSESMTIGSDAMRSPYRMDLALTYRCQNDCGHCYNEHKDGKELSVEQWKSVLDKLWAIGVPHVVFTGGEPTLYEHIDDLIRKSEELGQVTGLITNGRRLRQPGYLKELVRTGLDHVQITVLSLRESLHDELAGCKGAWKDTVEGLKVALGEDLYVSTNTTIMRANIDDVEETMKFLVGLGVKNIAFNSIIRSGKGEDTLGVGFEELKTVLLRLKEIERENGVNMIWYSPTPYCEFNPINFGLGIKQCTACSMNMAIEPDGTVLPCQSYYQPLGNILTDPWDRIWDHELCKDIRGRKYLEGKCVDCKIANICGGGCPLSKEHGDYVCLDRHSSM
jgi:radical SAM protein with 4Fe4S-binding SPASM domain